MIPTIMCIASVYGTVNVPSNEKDRLVAYWLINSYAVTWPFTLTIIGQNIARHTKRAVINAILFVFLLGGEYCRAFLLSV